MVIDVDDFVVAVVGISIVVLQIARVDGNGREGATEGINPHVCDLRSLVIVQVRVGAQEVIAAGRNRHVEKGQKEHGHGCVRLTPKVGVLTEVGPPFGDKGFEGVEIVVVTISVADEKSGQRGQDTEFHACGVKKAVGSAGSFGAKMAVCPSVSVNEIHLETAVA